MNGFKCILLSFVIVVAGIMAITTYLHLSTPKVYIDLNYFITEYQKNKNNLNINGAKRADYEHKLIKTFANEYVYYNGKIDIITRQDDYTYIIYMQDYDPISRDKVRCYINAAWKEIVYKLEKLQTIKIRGMFDDFFLGSISIHDCEIVLED